MLLARLRRPNGSASRWPCGSRVRSAPRASPCSRSASGAAFAALFVLRPAALSEPPGDVTFRQRLFGSLEELARRADLDDMTQVHEGGRLRDTGGLLHVVRHDDHGIVLFQVKDKVLDLRGCDRIEGGARLVHEDDLRLDREGARNAEALLLAARETRAALVERVLDLVPEGGLLQAGQHGGVQLVPVSFPVQSQPGRHVVVDGHRRKGVRFLEHHSDPPAHAHRGEFVNVVLVQVDLSFDSRFGNRLVHSIQATDQGGLATAGRPDDSADRVFLQFQVDVFDGEFRSVPRGQLLDADLGGQDRHLLTERSRMTAREAMLIPSIMTTRMSEAPHAARLSARDGEMANRKTRSGRASMGWSKPVKKSGEANAVIISGAVSPPTRAIPRRPPVTNALAPDGSTTRGMTF